MNHFGFLNIQQWNPSIQFKLHDVTYIRDSIDDRFIYYWATQDNNGSHPSLLATWTTDFNWRPSYSSNSQITFNTFDTNTNFSLRQKNFINNTKLNTTLYFNNRTEIESKAILSFVLTKNGTEKFTFSHPLFDGTGLYYVAKNPTLEYVFNNLYNISIELENIAL